MSTFLITQASGRQSQAVTQHLLASGATIHALARNPSTLPAALAQHPSVKVFTGESTDHAAILAAARGCAGVFVNTYPIPGVEEEQARTICAAALAAGVTTAVAATTMLTGHREIWDDEETEKIGLRAYYRSKAAVEEIVRTAGFASWTILRPAFIHFDYLVPAAIKINFPELATGRELAHCFTPGARMPHTDAGDVGRYAAAALRGGEGSLFAGREIELGHENLTIEEVAGIIERVSGGREVRVRARGKEEMERIAEMAHGQLFQLLVNVKDCEAVIRGAEEAQERFGMKFTGLEEALRRDREELVRGIAA